MITMIMPAGPEAPHVQVLLWAVSGQIIGLILERVNYNSLAVTDCYTVNDRSAFLQANVKSMRGEIERHKRCTEMFGFSGNSGEFKPLASDSEATF